MRNMHVILQYTIYSIVYYITNKCPLQPIDPRAFLIEQLEKMVATRDNGSDPPTLLDMSNLVAIFGLIDVTQRGRYVLKKYDIDGGNNTGHLL